MTRQTTKPLFTAPAYFPGDCDFCAASLLGFGGCTNLPKTYAVPVKSLVLNEQRAHEAVNLGPLRRAGARACCEWLRQICTTKNPNQKTTPKTKGAPHEKNSQYPGHILHWQMFPDNSTPSTICNGHRNIHNSHGCTFSPYNVPRIYLQGFNRRYS